MAYMQNHPRGDYAASGVYMQNHPRGDYAASGVYMQNHPRGDYAASGVYIPPTQPPAPHFPHLLGSSVSIHYRRQLTQR